MSVVSCPTPRELTKSNRALKVLAVTLPLVHLECALAGDCRRAAWFFVSLNDSTGSSQRGNQFRKDRGERCAASRVFSGSSPTANLVSIIKVQGMS